jgi:hypothetical protein
MGRVGQQVLLDEGGLEDRISVGLLARAFPRETVEAVVETANAREKRTRMLPSWLVVYYVLALALFMDMGGGRVMRNHRAAAGADRRFGWGARERDCRDGEHRGVLFTLRHGIPPFRSLIYSFASGSWTDPDVTAPLLRAAATRVVAGMNALVDVLTDTRAPTFRPGDWCSHCPLKATCPPAQPPERR